jgi:hypothetical protein
MIRHPIGSAVLTGTLACVACVTGALTSVAQNLPNAAFECAALAMHFGDDHPMAGEAERLFEIGRDAATTEWQQYLAQVENAEFIFGRHQFLAALPTDFFIGMGFQSALVAINEFIDGEIPARQPGDSFEIIADSGT